MLERQTTVEVVAAAKPTSSIATGKWIAALAAAVTPFCYLNGRAFHDGYLAHLHLAPSMFPTDVQGTFIAAARGWMEGSVAVLDGVAQALAAHWFLVAVLPIVLLTGLSAAVHHLITRAEARRGRATRDGPHIDRFRVIRAVLAPVRTLLFSAYAIYTSFALIGAALLLSIGPFVHVGARVAAVDLAKGFPNAPVVELPTPHAGVTTYRIIECADKFCALYRAGEITTVPLAAITWATSKADSPAR